MSADFDEVLGELSSDEEEETFDKEVKETEKKPTSTSGTFLDDLEDSDADEEPVMKSAPKKQVNLLSDEEDDEEGEDDEQMDEDDELVGIDESKNDLFSTSKTNKSVKEETDHDQLEQILGKKVKEADNWKERSNSELIMGRPYRLKSDRQPFYAKMPRFLHIQQAPYSNITYDTEAERKEFENATTIMRWRLDPRTKQPESNTRLLQWSDGTYQLLVGDSLFNAKVAVAEHCYLFERLNCKQVTLQSANKKSNSDRDIFGGDEMDVDDDEEADFDANERPKTPKRTEIKTSCLESCGRIANRFIFEPTSLDSDAHNLMSLRMTEKYKKDKRINVMDRDNLDDVQETNQRAIMRLEESRRLLAKQRRAQQADAAPRRVNLPSHYMRPYMNSDYLEGDDDNDFLDNRPLSALASAPKGRIKGRPRSGSDDDMGDEIDENEERSVDGDEDDGEDLKDFIEAEDDDGDEDVGSDDDDDNEESIQGEDEDDDEEPEAVDEDDDDEGDDGAMDLGDDEEKPKKKKDKASKKQDKESRKQERKEKKKQAKAAEKRINREDSTTPSDKKRKADDSDTLDRKESTKSQASSSRPSTSGSIKRVEVKEAADPAAPGFDLQEEEDEQVIVHQSKKQRKILMDSDDDE